MRDERGNGFYPWFPGRSPPSQTQLCSPSQSQGFKALERRCQQVAPSERWWDL